jgi:hypothetical protein
MGLSKYSSIQINKTQVIEQFQNHDKKIKTLLTYSKTDAWPDSTYNL